MRLSTPVAVSKVQVFSASTFEYKVPTGPVKPVMAKLPPKDLVVVLTNGQEPMGAVTAELSMLKVPFKVAVPAPVIWFAVAFVRAKTMEPLVSKISVPPLTVVVPV